MLNNEVFLECLTDILEEDRELFSVDIQSPVNLHDKHNVILFFRRGSESRAVEKNVSEGDRYY